MSLLVCTLDPTKDYWPEQPDKTSNVGKNDGLETTGLSERLNVIFRAFLMAGPVCQSLLMPIRAFALHIPGPELQRAVYIIF